MARRGRRTSAGRVLGGSGAHPLAGRVRSQPARTRARRHAPRRTPPAHACASEIGGARGVAGRRGARAPAAAVPGARGPTPRSVPNLGLRTVRDPARQGPRGSTRPGCGRAGCPWPRASVPVGARRATSAGGPPRFSSVSPEPLTRPNPHNPSTWGAVDTGDRGRKGRG